VAASASFVVDAQYCVGHDFAGVSASVSVFESAGDFPAGFVDAKTLNVFISIP
jgi:hypothetical protein